MTEREAGKMMAIRQVILRYVQDINWMKKNTPWPIQMIDESGLTGRF